MIAYIKEPEYDGIDAVTARSKARVDAETIFDRRGYTPIDLILPSKFSTSGFKRLKWHLESQKSWKNTFSKLTDKDTLIIQYPCTDFNLLLPNAIKSAKPKIILLIHDWEKFRHIENKNEGIGRRIKCTVEENLIKAADRIIVHNDIMKQKMVQHGLQEDRLISLGIFDYLIDDIDQQRLEQRKNQLDLPIIIAGNLTSKKSGYVYELPEETRFNLFGAGYASGEKPNIKYWGSFPPNDLPYHMEGSFGLVWDGTTSKTCDGATGNYLRINNPHKTSLYLASEIPVIIWSQAALATYIKNNKCGITVDSLDDIGTELSKMSESDYAEMRANTSRIATKLRTGSSLNLALDEVERSLV